MLSAVLQPYRTENLKCLIVFYEIDKKLSVFIDWIDSSLRFNDIDWNRDIDLSCSFQNSLLWHSHQKSLHFLTYRWASDTKIHSCHIYLIVLHELADRSLLVNEFSVIVNHINNEIYNYLFVSLLLTLSFQMIKQFWHLSTLKDKWLSELSELI